ncbi:hypothetical protein C4J81_19070 (plasmid) [Deltaproteobacteria bacterium Smac51]|nr:hypothetical protein C4J81_19070 [Deltaproteobacteria bacterium Smac51]
MGGSMDNSITDNNGTKDEPATRDLSPFKPYVATSYGEMEIIGCALKLAGTRSGLQSVPIVLCLAVLPVLFFALTVAQHWQWIAALLASILVGWRAVVATPKIPVWCDFEKKAVIQGQTSVPFSEFSARDWLPKPDILYGSVMSCAPAITRLRLKACEDLPGASVIVDGEDDGEEEALELQKLLTAYIENVRDGKWRIVPMEGKKARPGS